MIKLLFLFSSLLVAIWLGTLLQHDPGYVLVTAGHWSIETTLLIAVLSLLLLFFAAHFFLLLCHWLHHLPASFKQRWQAHRTKQARAKTRQGLIEFSEGHWQQAKNHLIKALPDTDTPLLNYLTAARAAQEMGDHRLRDVYLREAQQVMPDAKIAVELTQAQLQLANHQWEQALATLRHLKDLSPNHPYVLKLLMRLYEDIKDWSDLILLLPLLKSNHVLTPAEYERLQEKAYAFALTDLIKQNQTLAIDEFIKNLPRELTFNPTVMAEYSTYLLENNEHVKAEPILRRCLQKQFDVRLVTLYGYLKTGDKPLSFAESLLKKHPHSPDLLLCLARLCIREQLWGRAKQYLGQSLETMPTPAAYLELARLEEKLGDASAAAIAYREGLCLATTPSKIRDASVLTEA